MGRPPTPIEHKRRTARSPNRDAGGRLIAKSGTLIPLPAADGVPPYPEGLGLKGQQLWDRAWDSAIAWLSPKSDAEAIELAASLADDLELARERYHVTRNATDGRVVAALTAEMRAALADLGFNPIARTRLGVAEVTRVSKIEALKQQKRSG